MKAPARRWTFVALLAAAAVLVGSIVWTLQFSPLGHPVPGRFGFDRSATDLLGPAADVAGSVVDVVAMDMGGRGMMGRAGGHMGGTMLLRADRADVPSGTVTLRLYNAGTVKHELVVLPLADGQQIGRRSVGASGQVDESDSLGEASQTNGAGAGDGIDPVTTGWITLTLAPGRYEVVCNIEDHYAAGMYTLLVVS